MELGKWLKHAHAISIVVLLHINASLSLNHHHANLTRCVERERDALLAVKRDLVDNHNLLSSWGSGSEAQKKDCCRWERVYCDNQTGHVRRLDLGSDNSWPNSTYSGYFFSPAFEEKDNGTSHYDDDATFMWKGRMSSYKSTLGLVKRIDLSSNRLSGEIPSEITHLVGLISLNLSRNHLTGQITPDIGKLRSLDSLDLSRNQIDGEIPTSLAQIDRLGNLDLSYNDLSGEIPTGTQLQSFDPSVYAGNPQLCGRPLKKICDPEGTGQPNVSSNQEDHDELITEGFYISLGLGFAVGFWGVCGSLIFKRSWRYAYYKFLNVVNDWLYVKVALIRRQLKDVLN